MRLPPSMPLSLAASIPEAWLTAFQLLHFVGHVQDKDLVLVHAGARQVHGGHSNHIPKLLFLQ